MSITLNRLAIFIELNVTPFCDTDVCQCGNPPFVTNANTNPSSGPYNCGTTVSYSCFSGYILQGNKPIEMQSKHQTMGWKYSFLSKRSILFSVQSVTVNVYIGFYITFQNKYSLYSCLVHCYQKRCINNINWSCKGFRSFYLFICFIYFHFNSCEQLYIGCCFWGDLLLTTTNIWTILS